MTTPAATLTGFARPALAPILVLAACGHASALAADNARTVASAESALIDADTSITLQPAEAPPAEDAPKGWADGWTGSVEVGFSGSSGNSDVNNFRTLVNGARSTDTIDTSVTLLYRYSEQDGDDTENRFRGDLRNDWKFGEDSRWVFFLKGTAEWDEFQDWNWRLSGALGPGYYFIKNEKTTLLGRVGIGGSQEFGGDDDDFIPEGLVGIDFSHKLTEKQTLSFTSEYLPSFDDFGEFRWNSNARWTIKLDEENGLFLSVGVDHRYDSDPGMGFEESDFDYFVTLGWGF